MEVREGFDVLDLDDGQHVEIQTSVLEEKSAAFDALLAHSSTLGTKFGPYIRPTLELALPGLKVSEMRLAKHARLKGCFSFIFRRTFARFAPCM